MTQLYEIDVKLSDQIRKKNLAVLLTIKMRNNCFEA